MTVAELIAQLKTMPQDAPVSINNEVDGIFSEDIGEIFFSPEDKEYGDRACVTIVISE